MAIFQHISGLALQQIVDGACKALGVVAGASAGQAVAGFLEKRFSDHSRRLGEALTRAADRAWRALEISLAGESFWERIKVKLSGGEEQAFRAQVRAFLEATPLAGLPGHGEEYRQLALRELRAARKQGLLTAGRVSPQGLAEQVGHLATFGDPAEMVRAQAEALEAMAEEVRQAGFPSLAHLLTLRPLTLPSPPSAGEGRVRGDGGTPLIVLAVRFFFRREVEHDRELFQGLSFAQMEHLGQAQEAGFDRLAELLEQHGSRLEDMLSGVADVVLETHVAVLDIQQELRKVGQIVTSSMEQQHAVRRLADTSKPARTEQDLRLALMNTLLKTPHRQLEALCPLHAEVVTKDPLFYVRLAAWYFDHGDVRDHKEMFIVTLALSDFEGHRDAGLALLRELPPYEVVRVVDFIHGTKEQQGETVVEHGLGLNVPRSLRTEVTRYLAEREANPEWFDSTALVARKALKRLYALLHIAPSERAQKILFEDDPPADSRVADLKRLAKAGTPEEQAQAIVEGKVPFRIAVSVLPTITPLTLEALIERMSPQELINSLGLLQRRGAFADPNLKAMIDLKLEEAKRDKRVSAFKTEEAARAVPVDEQTRRKLEEVADVQIKARGRITRSTAVLIDKSGSMELAIDVGKRIAAMISTVCSRELFVYAFDKMAYPIVPKGNDLAAWQRAFAGINAGGLTACGVAVEMMRRKKQVVEQVVLVTDEEEYDPPYFVESLLRYQREVGVLPAICIVRVPDSSTRLQEQCKRAGLTVATFDFSGDYYSLPNLIPLLEPASELDLLLEIMDYPLPQRKPA
jgi:hypothetical protein